jgi:8-oxo-dGTP pyrophosphatase MutT (NUDIX family)
MEDYDEFPIYSVAVDPKYCPQCGTEVGTREFDAGPMPWCDSCRMVLSRVAVSAGHVVVRDDADVLVLDEPVEQHAGLLSLPGGYASHDEGPREAVVRELEEETGLVADPDDLEFVTIYHADTPRTGFHFATYALDRSQTTGALTPEAAGFEAHCLPVEDVLAATERIRDSDRERIAMAFDRDVTD